MAAWDGQAKPDAAGMATWRRRFQDATTVTCWRPAVVAGVVIEKIAVRTTVDTSSMVLRTVMSRSNPYEDAWTTAHEDLLFWNWAATGGPYSHDCSTALRSPG